jgi:hypothetical protein
MKERIKDILRILLFLATILALGWFARDCYRTYCSGDIAQYKREVEVGIRMNPNTSYMNDISQRGK